MKLSEAPQSEAPQQVLQQVENGWVELKREQRDEWIRNEIEKAYTGS